MNSYIIYNTYIYIYIVYIYIYTYIYIYIGHDAARGRGDAHLPGVPGPHPAARAVGVHRAGGLRERIQHEQENTYT